MRCPVRSLRINTYHDAVEQLRYVPHPDHRARAGGASLGTGAGKANWAADAVPEG